MAKKKEEVTETVEDNATGKTEVKSKPKNTGRVKKQEPPKDASLLVEKTLLDCIDELEDSSFIFEKLVKHGYYQQYKEERELRKQNRFIPPSITVEEFNKIMED